MSALRIALYTEGLPFTGDTLARRALGGSETAFLCVARELAALGHEVLAYCVCEREGRFDGVEYRHASRLPELRDRPLDLFICSRFFHALAQPIRARVRVLWMHDVLLPALAEPLRRLLPGIDRIFCVSHYHRRLTQAVLPEAAPVLAVAYNAVDHAAIEETLRGGVRKRHKLMYTSCPERGLLRALDLYERLGDRALELVVCGYVPLQPEHTACIEALRARGFPIRTERFTKQELYRELAESKAVLYPTHFPEVFCISAVEAQACGTAFLTVDDFALRETVGYERTPPGDDDAMLDRLRQVLGSAELRASMERRGREHARKYTWRAVAEQFAAMAGPVARPVDRLPELALFDRIGARPASPTPPPIARRRPVPARTGRPKPLAASGPRPASAPALVGRALPRISCLTVTRGRLRRLKRAIRCYCEQTYENRELVVVCDADARTRRAVERYVALLGRPEIRVEWCAPGRSLGALRNLSLDAAAGEIVCQWDDDDLYHPERLALQAAPLLESDAAACALTDQLHFFEDEHALFWIDWAAGGAVGGVWQFVPGTLMVRRAQPARYPETGAAASHGEDSAYLEALHALGPVLPLGGFGYVYLYTYHGANTFSAEHHHGQVSRAAPAEFIAPRLPALRRALEAYPLPRPYTLFSRTGPMLRVGSTGGIAPRPATPTSVP
ncbi:MAG TPA: glycosyltransferase [Longimicrobiales bacterium]